MTAVISAFDKLYSPVEHVSTWLWCWAGVYLHGWLSVVRRTIEAVPQ